MLIQDFLRLHEGLSGLDSLKEKYGISFSTQYDDIVVLNYSQTDSQAHKHDPIVKECRGLILEKNSWNVVARSFDRFFNYGECPEASKHDIAKAKVQEKLDGSLITAYWRYDRWNFATRRMAFAEGTNAFNVSFRQVIDKAFDVNKLNECVKEDWCVVFELTSPETRVVKRYSDYRLNLIGCRNRITQEELLSLQLDKMAESLNVPRPKSYSMFSFEDVVKNAKELPELDEGYVCVWDGENQENGSFYRLKIKNPAYLAVAHMRDNGEHSEKRVICLVMMNEQEEYLSYFPEDRVLFQKYVDAHLRMKEDIKKTWSEVKGIKDQKTFALIVKDKPISGILFKMKKGFTYEQIVDKMNDNTKINLFKGYMK